MNTPNPTSRANLAILLGILVPFVLPVISRAQTADASGTTTTTTTTSSVPTSGDVSSGSSQQQAITMSPFEVEGTSEEDGYSVKETNSSARVAQRYIDVSQTISVINSQFIDDYNIQDTRKLMESLPNVYQGSTDQASRIWIRGSEVDTVYVDGVNAGGSNAARPMQFYDRVELVSGPSSSAFGVGQPGGIINFLTKAPTGRTDTYVELGYGDHQNYLLNLDTEGNLPTSIFGKISYRAVGFWDRGNYQIKDEYHKGAGAMVALRDEVSSHFTIDATVEYSETNFPISDQPFILYSNQTAYTWLYEIIGGPDPGGGIPILPGTHPYSATDPNRVNGNYAGGQLLPAGTNGFPDNYGGFNDIEFRGQLVEEANFFDRALTIRNTSVLNSSNIDAQYITWQGAKYIDPSTGQPFTTVFPNNIGPVKDIGLQLFAIEIFHPGGGTRSDNLDVDFQKTFFGVDLRLSAGADIGDAWQPTQEYIYAPFTNPDGSPLWGLINKQFSVNIYKTPSQLAQADESQSWAWGGYVNVTASAFQDFVEAEWGDRRDAGGGRDDDSLHNRITQNPLKHSKGAPRESIRIKPFKWLSFYALRAEHDDPPQLNQRYSLFTPGSQPGALAAIYAKYNQFDNPFVLVPKGVLKEYGTKAEFLNGNLTFSADFFQFNTAGGLTTQVITDNNPSSPTYQSQVVENLVAANKASGGEIEAAGRITRHLTFTAAYGITRGKFAPFPDGNPNNINPPTTTMAHIKYDFGWIHGFDPYILFGGTRWGTFWTSQDPYVYYSSPQYLFDAGVGVKWDKGRQSLEASEDNVGGKIPFISPQTAYASGSSEQAFIKYKFRF